MIETLIDGVGGIPIVAVTTESFGTWKTETIRAPSAPGSTATGFTGEAGKTALVPGPDGQAVDGGSGCVDRRRALVAGRVARQPARGHLSPGLRQRDPVRHGRRHEAGARLGAGLLYLQPLQGAEARFARLVWPESADRAEVAGLAEGLSLARDLINTPAEDMGPAELAAAATKLAETHGAKIKLIVGDELLAQNYPTIHAVGRGSARAPRLIDLTWGDEAAPKLTLVGKGVCFDSGGLDIKSAAGMKMMKKDMGGSATVLGLAQAIMAAASRIRLRVLVPAVENSISGTAFRPMDVFKTRKGLTVEIGNTDAEGRLVLCDALAEAVTEEPALVIDMATLTGAARVALGPELPVLFSNNDAVAAALLEAGTVEAIRSGACRCGNPIANISTARSPTSTMHRIRLRRRDHRGALSAGVRGSKVPWIHIDTFAWNQSTRAGRPEGGEGLALRALFHLIRKRFG
jgi:leucyl aminopeptidase